MTNPADTTRSGAPVWSGHAVLADARAGSPASMGASLRAEVRFIGRPANEAGRLDEPEAGANPAGGERPWASSRPARRRVLADLEAREGLTVVGLRQVHSDRIVVLDSMPNEIADEMGGDIPGEEASQVPDPGEGLAGEGDGLVTGTAGLALSVVTADCVPVILAGPVRRSGAAGESDPTIADAPHRPGPALVAAVHAGWRGIVAGVVARALDELTRRGVPAPTVAAWIGPAIGACCYEVSEDVAARVASVSGPECIVPRPAERSPSTESAEAGERARPHLDLVAAVRHQLTAAGVPSPRIVLRCTRCDTEHLWSYRRDGKAAGRNHAFVWLEPDRSADRSAGELAAHTMHRGHDGGDGPEASSCG